jgi:hypothetical protein
MHSLWHQSCHWACHPALCAPGCMPLIGGCTGPSRPQPGHVCPCGQSLCNSSLPCKPRLPACMPATQGRPSEVPAYAAVPAAYALQCRARPVAFSWQPSPTAWTSCRRCCSTAMILGFGVAKLRGSHKPCPPGGAVGGVLCSLDLLGFPGTRNRTCEVEYRPAASPIHMVTLHPLKLTRVLLTTLPDRRVTMRSLIFLGCALAALAGVHSIDVLGKLGSDPGRRPGCGADVAGLRLRGAHDAAG